MKKRFLSLLLAAVLVLSLVPAVHAAGETRLYDWAFEIFDDMNALRAQNGVAPLTMDETFLECAMIRAAELASNYSHTRPNGRQWYTVYTGSYKSMGENIGYGYTSAQEAHQLWANSKDHRDNILNPDYAVCGVGMVRIGNTVYGVELFGDASCLNNAVSGSQYGASGGNTLTTSSQPANSTVAGFSDVSANSYYADAVKWAVNKRIVTGTSSTTFSPDSVCTRAEAMTFLWRNAGSPRVTSSSGFRDVPSGVYYTTAVAWAHRNGIAEGTSSTTFSPNQTCTRAQIVEFIYRWKT